MSLIRRCECGSFAINHHMHGRDPNRELGACDVCYWRNEADRLRNCIRALWHRPHEVRPFFILHDLTQDEIDMGKEGAK